MECGTADLGAKWSISLGFAEVVANIGFPGVTSRRVFVYGNAFMESLRTVQGLFSYAILFVIYRFVFGAKVSVHFSFVASLIPWPLLLLFQFFKPVLFVCVAIYLVTTFVVGVERFIEKFVIEVNTRRNAGVSKSSVDDARTESSMDDAEMSESSVSEDEQEDLGSDGSPFYHQSFTWSSQQDDWGWRFEGRFHECSSVSNSQHGQESGGSFSQRSFTRDSMVAGGLVHFPFVTRLLRMSYNMAFPFISRLHN